MTKQDRVLKYLELNADMDLFTNAAYRAYTARDYKHAMWHQFTYLATRDEWMAVCDVMTDREYSRLNRFLFDFNGA